MYVHLIYNVDDTDDSLISESKPQRKYFSCCEARSTNISQVWSDEHVLLASFKLTISGTTLSILFKEHLFKFLEV